MDHVQLRKIGIELHFLQSYTHHCTDCVPAFFMQQIHSGRYDRKSSGSNALAAAYCVKNGWVSRLRVATRLCTRRSAERTNTSASTTAFSRFSRIIHLDKLEY